MNSKTSFFNRTIFLKNIKQLWPLWGTYLALSLIFTPLSLLNSYSSISIHGYEADFMYEILYRAQSIGLIFSTIFSVLSAIALFSFLYNLKSTGFYSSLPMKRSGLFFTQFLSGLIWLIGSNFITAVVLILVESSVGAVSLNITLQWFAIVSIYCLFYYSFAVFCAVLTGHNMVAIPLFIVLNFCVVIVENIVRTIMASLVFGLSTSFDTLLDFLSPPYYMAFFKVRYLIENDIKVGAAFENWTPLCFYALVGIVLIGIAYLIFKKRHMETASDVVAVNILKPVFRVCMGLGSAICGGFLLNLIFPTNYFHVSVVICIYMIISAFIGFFAADMLVKKSFKVFTCQRWIEFLSICSVIILFVSGFALDLFGLKSYIPDVKNISFAQLHCQDTYKTDDPEVIADIISIHKMILNYADYIEHGDYESILNSYGIKASEDYIPLTYHLKINYTLNNGKSVSRYYRLNLTQLEVEHEGTIGNLIDKVMNSTTAISQRLHVDKNIDLFDSVFCSGEIYDTESNEFHQISLNMQQVKYLYTNCLPVDIANGHIGKLNFGSEFFSSDIYAETSEADTDYPAVKESVSIYIDFRSTAKVYYDTIQIDVYDTSSETYKYIIELYENEYN